MGNVAYLETLGTFGLSQFGRALRFPRAKEKALIAFLTVNAGRAYQRDYLANLLWQGSSAENSKHSLNQALYTIKRIAPALLTVRGTSIEIATASIRTDLTELGEVIHNGTLLENLTIIRGEFLADLSIRGAPDFESWQSDYNRQLFFKIDAAVRRELLELEPHDRAEIALKLPPLATISPALQLSDYLELVPESQQPALEVKEQQKGNPFILPLVGREQQLKSLLQKWELCRTGTPQFASVVGHAGHGKTRLMDEFVRVIASDGPKVLRARCYQSERRIAFGPLLEIFAEDITTADLDGIEAIWLAALQEVIPSLHAIHESAPQLSVMASQSRFYEAVLKVITSISERAPLLIFIDDVQWADESTQALLSFLAHRVKGSLMLAVAERSASPPTGPTPPWRNWTQVAVEELSGNQLAEVVRRVTKTTTFTPPPALELERLTRGHPYMATELIRSALAEGGSNEELASDSVFVGVDAFIGSLLSELPKNAQRVASALSIIGRPAPVNLIAKVSRSADLISGVDLLSERGLVSRMNGKVALRHDLVRESIYRRLPLFTRIELHRRAAMLLAHNSKYVGETAEHYYRARDRKNCHTFAKEAAREADSRYANDESIYFLRLAIKSGKGEQAPLRVLLAERLYRSNRKREAIAQINHIRTKSGSLTGVDSAVWEFRALELAYDTGRITGPALREALVAMESTIPADEIVLLASNLYLRSQSAFHDGNRQIAAVTHHTIKSLAHGTDSAGAVTALAIAAQGHAFMTSASEADQWAIPLRSKVDAIDDPELKIRVLFSLSSIAYATGRLLESSCYNAMALREINRAGAMNLWAINTANAQMLHMEQGRFNEANSAYEEIRSRAIGLLDVQATACANASIMHYAMGDFARAKEAAISGLSQLESRKSTWTELVLHAQLGLSCLELGDFTKAAQNADYLTNKLTSLGARAVDLSSVEILIARVATLKGHRQAGISRLRTAIHDYLDRDIICRLRLQLELGRMLKSENAVEAKALAKQVYEKSRACNAVIIADAADSLLARL